jgi:hypothetical protein
MAGHGQRRVLCFVVAVLVFMSAWPAEVCFMCNGFE